MKKKNRVTEIGFAVSCVVFYAVAALKLFSDNPGIALPWFCMGTMFLCMFAVERNKRKKREKEEQEKNRIKE